MKPLRTQIREQPEHFGCLMFLVLISAGFALYNWLDVRHREAFAIEYRPLIKQCLTIADPKPLAKGSENSFSYEFPGRILVLEGWDATQLRSARLRGIPRDRLASSPDSIGCVVVLFHGSGLVGYYSGPGGDAAWRNFMKIVVVDWESRRVVGQDMVRGTEPPKSITLVNGSPQDSKREGSEPTDAAILDCLKSHGFRL